MTQGSREERKVSGRKRGIRENGMKPAMARLAARD